MRKDDEIRSYCTVLKAGTKANKYRRAIYNRYSGRELSDIYGRFSSAKANAMKWCKNRCEEEGGINFHISSYNCMKFTVSWLLSNGAVRVETAYHSYYCE